MSANYPEHLNPFRSKSNGVRESFRSIKNAIGGRFVRKKKDDDRLPKNSISAGQLGSPILRHHSPQTNGAPRSETLSDEVWLRSRFPDRVKRAQTLGPNATQNPFDESAKKQIDDKSLTVENGTAHRRRRKKRAPLPPPGSSNLTVPGGSHSQSQWSLSSYETDYSSAAYTHSENEDVQTDDPERLKDIQEISKEIQHVFAIEEMEKTPETTPEINNNKVETVDTEETVETEKPEVPVETEKHNGVELKVEESEEEKVPEVIQTEIETKIKDNPTEVYSVPSSISDKPSESSEAIIKDEIENDIAKEVLQENDNNKGISEEISNSIEDEIKDEVVIEKNNLDKHKEVEIVTEIDYVEHKSLYVAGSVDNLDKVDFNERFSLYITNSQNNLDLDSVPPAPRSEDDDGLKATVSPTPKIRKHKLSKEALLGSSDVINASERD